MPKTLTWLHLSDLHLCQPETGWEATAILEALCKDLKEMQDCGLRPDLIFFTGDAAYGQLGEGDRSIDHQFSEALSLFEQIRKAFNPEIPIEDFFIVPGNHDINRKRVLSATTTWLDGLEKAPDGKTTIEKMIRDVSEDWQAAMKRLESYGPFLAMVAPHLLQDEKRLIYGITRNIHGIEVGVAGLNSAWSSSRDGEKGHLWLGGHWQTQTLNQKIAKADIKIALVHHPINWLVEREDPELNSEFERSFHFLLHGHEHQEWVMQINEKHVRISAGACYGSSESESGYNFVQLNLDDGTGKVWLRKYESKCGGWGPRFIHGKTDEGGVWNLKNLPWRTADVATPKIDAISQPILTQPPANDGPESRGVFGRQADIAKITKSLTQKPIAVVYGMSGIGKSVLIQEIKRSATFQSFRYTRFNVYPNLKVNDLYRHLAPALGCVEEPPPPIITMFGKTDFSMLARFARSTSPCIIHLERAHHLFDEGFHDPDIKEFLLAITEYAPQTRIVLESREKPPQNLVSSDSYEIFQVTGLNRQSVQAFFKHPFRQDPTKGWTLNEAEADIVYRRLGGKDRGDRAHPLGMVLLADVADGMQESPAQVLKRHEQLLVSQLQERLFRELYESVLNNDQRRQLRLCSLYRDTIPDLHVDQLNDRAGEKDAFARLIRLCLLSPDERQESYSLHHLIADLTQRQIDKSSDEFYEDHERVADAWLSRFKLSQHPSLPSIMAAAEAAYHLTQAQCYERLSELPSQLLRQGDVTDYLERLSTRLHVEGKSKENRLVLELLVAIDPRNHKAHRFLAESIKRSEGEGSAEALQHYEEAYRLDPLFPPYLASLGRCLLARGTPAHFVALVEKLDTKSYDAVMDAHCMAIYADCLAASGKTETASSLRQKQIEAGSRNTAFYNDESIYLRDAKRFDNALRVLDRAEQVGITDAYFLSVRASIIERQGHGDDASQLRQKQIEAGSRDAAFYNDEAIYLRAAERFDEALRVLDRAEQIGITDDYLPSIRASILERLAKRNKGD